MSTEIVISSVRLISSSRFEFWNRIARRFGWMLTLALVLLMLRSAFSSEQVPFALKMIVGGLALLAALRPGDALIVVAGLVPLANVLTRRIWSAYAFALSEALVLAFIAGYLWHERRSFGKTAAPDGMYLASRLFSLLILASCLVQLAELQTWHNYPLLYASGFISFLANDYLTPNLDPRPWVDGRTFVTTAALLLEGIALLSCSRTLCGRQCVRAHSVTNVIVMAGVGVALLSLYEPMRVALSTNQSLAAAVASVARWSSPAIPSLNSAGAYFMLIAFVAIGTAAASRTTLIPGILASLISILGLWLTNTRTAIVAGLATTAAAAAWRMAGRVRWLSSLQTALLAAGVALVVGVSVVAYNPSYILGAQGNQSLYERVLLSETALRMMAASPLFGVGPSRFELAYRHFAVPELLQQNITYNPHNYFLWIGAELGVIGLVLFVWLIGQAFAVVWRQLAFRPSDYWLLATSAGLVAFVISWSGTQPLDVPQVAYTFWILLGVVTGYSIADPGAARPLRRYPTSARLALAAAVVLIAGSVPIRAHRAVSQIDLSRVSYGFYNSGSADGREFRWAGPRARFYHRSSVKAIRIPLAAKLPDTPNGADVDILVNGRVAHHIELRDKAWHDVRVNAPDSTDPFWQVDLEITPIDVPADLEDARRRVSIGEISVEARQEDHRSWQGIP
jgi:O-antigen ligase